MPAALAPDAALAALLATGDLGVVFQDTAGRIVTANDRALAILGLPAGVLEGQTSHDRAPLTIREDGTPFPGDEHPAMVALRTGAPQRGVLMGVHRPGGDLRWITIDSRVVPAGEPPAVVGVVSAFTDVTERRAAEQEVERLLAELAAQARTDPLTGLANRRALDERLADELRRARRDGRPAALVLVDVNGFKLLNDTWGHPVGDEVLTAIGTVLRAVTREVDLAARLAGDEFALVLPATGTAEARAVVARLHTAIAADPVLARRRVTVAAGTAAGTADAEWLYRSADAALYAVKRA
jgi:diguanylate cyclase (GGDEF)-like protein/PAS domain S-box-containing protein